MQAPSSPAKQSRLRQILASKLLPLFFQLMLIFMYLPILVLAVYSVNDSRFSAKWEGFTWRWYPAFFSNERLVTALQRSLLIAILSVAIAAVLGTLMAVGLARYRFRGKTLYRGVSYLPLIVPDITMAVGALVVLLGVFHLKLSLWTIVAAHIVFCLSYIAVVVSARLAGLDPQLEEAALDLGATPAEAFVKVLLPELAPGILSGCLLSFILSMDDFLIASFTAGPGVGTLPMEIFSLINKGGVKPDINALSVILILASAALAFVAEYIRFQSEQKRLADD